MIIFFYSSIIELFFRIFFIALCFPSLYNLLIFFYSRLLLIILGVISIPYKYKKHKKTPDIIFSSQSSFIDWLILIYNYNPKILFIAKSKDNKKDSFIELSYFNIFAYGAGIKFDKYNQNKKYFDIVSYLRNKNKKRPLLIFPEVTKSNRLAVLSIRSNLMDTIYKELKNNENINIRSELIINKNHEINTTDTFGLKHLFNLCCNYYIPIELYSQDIKNENLLEENNQYDNNKYQNYNIYLDSIIQEYLMEPNHRNTVSIDSFEHEKFIEYFKKTNKDSKANYVKNK
jgi:hypothetical protein